MNSPADPKDSFSTSLLKCESSIPRKMDAMTVVLLFFIIIAINMFFLYMFILMCTINAPNHIPRLHNLPYFKIM